jgi:hypothetical protein
VVDDLTTPDALSGYAGAPFSAASVKAAAASVRSECRWHIAPEVTTTSVIRTGGAREVLLPTLKLAQVTSIEALSLTGTPEPWRPDSQPWWSVEQGILLFTEAPPVWIRVEFKHGYEECPEDVLQIVADRAAAVRTGGRVRQESLLGRSVSLDTSAIQSDSPLAAYTLGWQP